MKILLVMALGAALAAGVESAAQGKKAQSPDPIQQEYERLVKKDETALNEVERLVNEFHAFREQGGAASRAAMSARVDQIIERVKKDYEDFLRRNSKHVEGHLAYGSFLNEIGDEPKAIEIWEKARELDPKNPSAWNNLANVFGHSGPVKKAFQYYEKAIELDPNEPVYLQNFATTTYLYRKDAAETYRIDEAAVFDKSLELYMRAMKLKPYDLELATQYAQSYYGITPLREKAAVEAWTHCLSLAKSDVERQGVHLHLARVNWMADHLDKAEEHLAKVNHPEMQELKTRIQRNVDKKRAGTARVGDDLKDAPDSRAKTNGSAQPAAVTER